MSDELNEIARECADEMSGYVLVGWGDEYGGFDKDAAYTAILSACKKACRNAWKEYDDCAKENEQLERELEGVWSGLSSLVSCTSPDGSAELDQVGFLQLKLQQAEADNKELKRQIARLEKDIGQARDDLNWGKGPVEVS